MFLWINVVNSKTMVLFFSYLFTFDYFILRLIACLVLFNFKITVLYWTRLGFIYYIFLVNFCTSTQIPMWCRIDNKGAWNHNPRPRGANITNWGNNVEIAWNLDKWRRNSLLIKSHDYVTVCVLILAISFVKTPKTMNLSFLVIFAF